ncbi:hypothetical protein U9M48_008192 [Paspalum notatum var. saurae]|uniref:Uncharacterized protein n=1 Tax=Paspalum notatum var. saurae TaxID=547442 RepID=A0AAQ3SP62_PASNO
MAHLQLSLSPASLPHAGDEAEGELLHASDPLAPSFLATKASPDRLALPVPPRSDPRIACSQRERKSAESWTSVDAFDASTARKPRIAANRARDLTPNPSRSL